MGRRRRSHRAEGAEKSYGDRGNRNMYLPATRGGQQIKYFEKYPNASGAWIPKLEE